MSLSFLDIFVKASGCGSTLFLSLSISFFLSLCLSIYLFLSFSLSSLYLSLSVYLYISLFFLSLSLYLSLCLSLRGNSFVIKGGGGGNYKPFLGPRTLPLFNGGQPRTRGILKELKTYFNDICLYKLQTYRYWLTYSFEIKNTVVSKFITDRHFSWGAWISNSRYRIVLPEELISITETDLWEFQQKNLSLQIQILSWIPSNFAITDKDFGLKTNLFCNDFGYNSTSKDIEAQADVNDFEVDRVYFATNGRFPCTDPQEWNPCPTPHPKSKVFPFYLSVSITQQ